MKKLNEIIEQIQNISAENIFEIITAIIIIIFFRIFRGTIAYIIIKMFKFKEKDTKKIKKNAFYEPLKSFLGFLGVYLAIIFLKTPFNISDNIMEIITKCFKIIVIITTAIGLANSINTSSGFIAKIEEKSNRGIDQNTIVILIRVIRFLIYFIGGFLVITELGYNLNGLITGLGVGSVLITFAAQDTAKNMFGGLTIILDQPFKIGDSIQVDKYKGTVEDITFRSTRIRTSDDTIIYLPNAQVSASAVINNSRKNKNIYRTTITIDVSTNFQKIEKCKYEIIKLFTENELIIKDSINVRIINITEKGAELLIECAIDTVEMAVFNNIKEEFNYRIMQIFVNENIELVGNLQVVKIRREQ